MRLNSDLVKSSIIDDFKYINLDNSIRLKTLDSLENHLKFKNQKLHLLEVVEKGIKGNDNTRLVLDIIENLKTKWRFYAFDSSSKFRYKYYDENLFDSYFFYEKGKDSDYKNNIQTNTILYSKSDKKQFINDLVLFRPVKGKRKYKEFQKLKKIFLHKHLGARNGCVLDIELPNDEKQHFRSSKQSFLLKTLYYSEDGRDIFIKMQNLSNQDVLILKGKVSDETNSYDEVLTYFENFDNKSTNLTEIIQSSKTLSTLKKKLFYAGTFGELFLVAGGAVALATYFGIEAVENQEGLLDVHSDRLWEVENAYEGLSKKLQNALKLLEEQMENRFSGLESSLNTVEESLNDLSATDLSRYTELKEALATLKSDFESLSSSNALTIEDLKSKYEMLNDLELLDNRLALVQAREIQIDNGNIEIRYSSLIRANRGSEIIFINSNTNPSFLKDRNQLLWALFQGNIHFTITPGENDMPFFNWGSTQFTLSDLSLDYSKQFGGYFLRMPWGSSGKPYNVILSGDNVMKILDDAGNYKGATRTEVFAFFTDKVNAWFDTNFTFTQVTN